MNNETKLLMLQQKCYALANANKILKDEIEYYIAIINSLKEQIRYFEQYSLDLEEDLSHLSVNEIKKIVRFGEEDEE